MFKLRNWERVDMLKRQILISQGTSIPDFAWYTNYWPQYISREYVHISFSNLILYWIFLSKDNFSFCPSHRNVSLWRIFWKNDKRFQRRFPPKRFPLFSCQQLKAVKTNNHSKLHKPTQILFCQNQPWYFLLSKPTYIIFC